MSQNIIPNGSVIDIFDHEGFKIGWGMFLSEIEEEARHQQEYIMTMNERYEKIIALVNKYEGQPAAVVSKFWGELKDLLFPQKGSSQESAEAQKDG